MSYQKILDMLEELIEDKRVTFGYNPKGDEDWYVSVAELKKLILEIEQYK